MAAVAPFHDDADRHGFDPILDFFAQGAPLEIFSPTQTLVPHAYKASGNIGAGDMSWTDSTLGSARPNG
jgi:hypothetical protein